MSILGVMHSREIDQKGKNKFKSGLTGEVETFRFLAWEKYMENKLMPDNLIQFIFLKEKPHALKAKAQRKIQRGISIKANKNRHE